MQLALLVHYHSATGVTSNLRDKPEVVTNNHHSSIKVINGLRESIDRLHIKVVCGLVKQQQVRSLPRQPRKDHSTSLSI